MLFARRTARRAIMAWALLSLPQSPLVAQSGDSPAILLETAAPASAPAPWVVDTLVDPMKDEVDVRARVRATIVGADSVTLHIGMYCSMPKKRLEGFLTAEPLDAVKGLVSKEATTDITGDGVVDVFDELAIADGSTYIRMRWDDLKAGMLEWLRHYRRSGIPPWLEPQATAKSFAQRFQRHQRLRMEIWRPSNTSFLADVPLGTNATEALRAVFAHCARELPKP